MPVSIFFGDKRTGMVEGKAMDLGRDLVSGERENELVGLVAGGEDLSCEIDDIAGMKIEDLVFWYWGGKVVVDHRVS